MIRILTYEKSVEKKLKSIKENKFNEYWCSKRIYS